MIGSCSMLQGAAECYLECCVKRCLTKTCGFLTAHEVVEVDGFVFKRKRRVPPGESDNLASDSTAKRARVDSEHPDSDASVHPVAEAPATQTNLASTLSHHADHTLQQQGHAPSTAHSRTRHVQSPGAILSSLILRVAAADDVT